jgi:rRNA maturation protein Nop10
MNQCIACQKITIKDYCPICGQKTESLPKCKCGKSFMPGIVRCPVCGRPRERALKNNYQ